MALRPVIWKAVVFLGLVVILNTCILLLTVGFMERTSFQLPNNVSTLVLGDSQVQCAIDDSILACSKNIAHAGEAYLYTYLKARRFIASNPGLDTIWLAYNFNSLDREQNERLRSVQDKEHKLPDTFFMLQRSDMHPLQDQLSTYTVVLRAPYLCRDFIKKALQGPTTYRDLNFGDHYPLVRDDLASDVSLRRGLLKKNSIRSLEFGKGNVQAEYLAKIIHLCREHGIICILISTPVHPVVKAQCDTAAYYTFWREQLSGTPLWDHSDWTFPDSCFGDAIHLNYRGAKLYSQRLKAMRSNRWTDLSAQ